MNVGHGATISDKWIPKDIPTGLLDIEGVEIKTRDRVRLNGCTARHAVIGYDIDGKTLMLFFGTDKGVSVGWNLNEERIKTNKVIVDNI